MGRADLVKSTLLDDCACSQRAQQPPLRGGEKTQSGTLFCFT